MPTVVQFRRGTTSQNNSFTGAVGELSVDTDLTTLRVHDGATAGGVEIVNVSSVQTMQNKVFASDLLPAADSAYDLGDSDFKWKDLHLSGNTIYLGDAAIHSTGTAVRLPVGSVIGSAAGTILDSASALAILSGGTGITYNSGTGEISTTDGDIVHDNLSGFVADEHIAHSGVTMTAGSGLTGGGTIAATRTFNIGQGTGITVSADAIATNDAQIVHDSLSGFVADEHVAHSGVTLTAGAGLTGGGTIAASRTFNIGAGTGVTVNADDIAIGQDVATTANVTFATMETTGNVIVGGNLTVNGTTTTVNTETINLADNVILINSNEAGTPSQDGGIEIERGTSANKTLIWNETTDKWTIGSETFVANTFEGDLTGDVTGNAATATKLATARTIGLSGDVTATGVSFDGTGNITLTTAMAANSVDLTTHTTGNYVASITNGSYITGANGGSEGAGLTLAVDATSANTASKVVARDGSGNFSAGTITAALSGNATTATTLATARTIGGVSFNGSANINLPGVNTAGNQSTTGNAATATALATGRTISLTGDATGTSGSFNGTGNVSISVSLAANTVTSSELSGATSLIIYNSSGTALKTLYGAGS